MLNTCPAAAGAHLLLSGPQPVPTDSAPSPVAPDNPHYSIGEPLVCVSETQPRDRIVLTVRAAAGGGSFASVWAVAAELPGRQPRLLAARTAWAPNS